MVGRARCPERRCGWSGPWPEALSAPHPFQEGETIYGCPKCRQAGNVQAACWKSGC